MTSTHDFEHATKWDLPIVDDANPSPKDSLSSSNQATDAFNRPRGQWKYEAPEAEEEIKPLTASDIEAIRQAAHSEGLKAGHAEGFEQGKTEGFAEGHEQGLKTGEQAGHAEGLKTAEHEIELKIQNLSKLIDSLHKPMEQVDKEVQQELVLLAISLAKAVVNVEISQNKEVLLHAIDEAIAVLPANEKHYHISVNNDDYEWLSVHYDQASIEQKKWRLSANESIAKGGCKVHTDDHAVDVSIEKRSREIFSKMLAKQGLSNDPRAS